jgi:hypothetical protein
MEKVVYILGAGFSAPLGLPVMSNFIVKAKDLYFSDVKRYAHFHEIFELINRMSIIKNYFETDLYNIEEVLSILEMNEYLSENNSTEKFKMFLKDVIEYYTPAVNPYPNRLPSNWHDVIFGHSTLSKLYGFFVAELFNLEFKLENKNDMLITAKSNLSNTVEYSVITLNYDLVLEKSIQHLNSVCVSKPLNFNNDNVVPSHSVILSKLHGCVEKMNIVPPTWNKTSNESLLQVWKNAQSQLKEANHIRIIGYSLPLSDSYMKFMFKSSLLDSRHLKSIDVITLDPTGEIQQRYDQFIDYNYYSFKNGNVIDYLTNLHDLTNLRINNHAGPYIHRHLEDAHKRYMGQV